MINLAYVGPRLIRHFLPENVTRFLLLRSLIIKPGLETADAAAAVTRYTEVLASQHDSLLGKRVLVFGYGGRFDVGIGLIQAGARHVTLCDRYARPDNAHNRKLTADHPQGFRDQGNSAFPNLERLQLIHGDIRTMKAPADPLRYDLVISNSVYEHLDDAEGVTQTLANWTDENGIQIHFVDLRDHYFKYPFEMLRYSEGTWRAWLNPSSNHNRLRLWDYRRMFEATFKSAEIEILARDEAAFQQIRNQVRPEFISGKDSEDSVTLIRIVARRPRRT